MKNLFDIPSQYLYGANLKKAKKYKPHIYKLNE
jgi:hypothetical protein